MPNRTKHQPRDIYQEVTDRIVAALENGVAPWVRPWHTDGVFPRNGVTRRHYHGINVFLLWMTANAFGYRSQDWFTFNQARQQGGTVRKGERGTLVTFWKLREVADRDAAALGQDRTKRVPVLRHFVVFNRDQIDNLPPAEAEQPTRHDWERDERAESFVRATGARIEEGGSRASYSPPLDVINLPPLEAFHSRDAYYGTALHELAHWTGHPSRLDRDLSGPFGSEKYAREELTAEMGAAFLCAALNVSGRLQHPEYIGHWIKTLKGDKKAVFRAASEARQVAEYLGAIRPAASTEDEEEGAANFAAAA